MCLLHVWYSSLSPPTHITGSLRDSVEATRRKEKILFSRHFMESIDVLINQLFWIIGRRLVPLFDTRLLVAFERVKYHTQADCWSICKCGFMISSHCSKHMLEHPALSICSYNAFVPLCDEFEFDCHRRSFFTSQKRNLPSHHLQKSVKLMLKLW